MGRHGYTEDGGGWQWVMWRGRVASAMRGRRGQRLLRELRDALDAMPEKRLIADDLVTEEGDCCAIGAVLVAREAPDPQNLHEDNESIAEVLDVAECLVQEIEWENDAREGPEERWKRMRAWVEKQIKEEADDAS